MPGPIQFDREWSFCEPLASAWVRRAWKSECESRHAVKMWEERRAGAVRRVCTCVRVDGRERESERGGEGERE